MIIPLFSKPKKKTISFYKYAFVNMAVLFVGLLFYWFIWGWTVANIDLGFFQSVTTSLIYIIQSSIGWPVQLSLPNILYYSLPSPGFGVEIITLCIGFGEMLFFTFLIALFRGATIRSKIKGLIIFLPTIFAINLLRLLMLYPMAEWLGINGMWDLHWHIWKWGMFVLIMVLFVLWFQFIARFDRPKTWLSNISSVTSKKISRLTSKKKSRWPYFS